MSVSREAITIRYRAVKNFGKIDAELIARLDNIRKPRKWSMSDLLKKMVTMAQKHGI